MEQPNLSYINTLSGGDKSFEEKLISIIKKEFPEEKEVYVKNITSNNYKLSAENVHKLKHKINILGLVDSYKVAENYEKNLLKNNTTGQTDFELILESMSNYLDTL